jgi:uncharacterized membrane protein YfcA
MSVNVFVIILLGGGVGILSGLFGVGGGFLTTPLLIFFGIPPAVAAASAATQVAGSSVSGVMAHLDRDGVDVKMGALLASGGVFGSITGGVLFSALQGLGQIDTVISLLYVVLLGAVGGLMARDSWRQYRQSQGGIEPLPRTRHHHPLVARLPFRMRFYSSGVYISPIAPLALGLVTGILTVLLGVGGGFLMIPALVYLLGVAARVVVGTSLMQILIVTIFTTMVHAVTTKAVDVVLAGLLLIGGVFGAQLGARIGAKASPESLRVILACIVLAVAFRMLVGLSIRPDEIYTVDVL